MGAVMQAMQDKSSFSVAARMLTRSSLNAPMYRTVVHETLLRARQIGFHHPPPYIDYLLLH